LFIPDPVIDFLPISETGSRGQKGTGSRIWIRNKARLPIFCYVLLPGVMNVADQGDKKKSSQQLLMRYPPQAEKYMG
jgi:hypothetical protein